MLDYIFTQIAGYRGWILQQYNVASFRDHLKELLASNFTLQIPHPVNLRSKSDDREVYRLKIKIKEGNSKNLENPQSWSEIYIKRYYTVNWKQRIQTLLHSHKAQKSWKIGKTLIKREIPTPLPIAYLTRKKNPLQGGAGGESPLQGGVRGGSFLSTEHVLVTQGIENGVRLSDYIRRYVQMNPELAHERLSLSEKRELIRSVAEFLAHLHTEGIYHGDFTARNILVEDMRHSTPPYPPQGGIPTPCPSKEGIISSWPPSTSLRTDSSKGESLFRIYLVDLDAVRSTRWISDQRRIKNLDEIGRNFLDLRVFSTTDRGRFLQYYLGANPKETRTFKQLFRCVLQRTQKRLRKYGKDFSSPPTPPPSDG